METNESLTRFLQSKALFGGLSDSAMPPVMAILKPENFAAGEVIVREGEPGDRMYFIVKGVVALEKDATPEIPDDDIFAILHTLKAGDVFGEMGLLDTQPRSATVRALEPVEALSLSGGDLYRLYRDEPKTFTIIILNLARELSRRLRLMDERLALKK